MPFLERFALAREAGFCFVEYHFPYEYSVDELRRRLNENGLRQVLFNLPPGDWQRGDRGIAAKPERVAEFREGIALAVEYAVALGVDRVNCLAGIRSTGYDDAHHRDVLIDNLRYAAKVLAEKDLTLVIEPINHFDMPGFFLNKTELALGIIEQVAVPNLLVQYDVYHAQREGENPTVFMEQIMPKIGHIQIADFPGRNEPGTGRIDYGCILKKLDNCGYGGYVGLEYYPSRHGSECFAWMKDLGYCR